MLCKHLREREREFESQTGRQTENERKPDKSHLQISRGNQKGLERKREFKGTNGRVFINMPAVELGRLVRLFQEFQVGWRSAGCYDTCRRKKAFRPLFFLLDKLSTWVKYHDGLRIKSSSQGRPTHRWGQVPGHQVADVKWYGCFTDSKMDKIDKSTTQRQILKNLQRRSWLWLWSCYDSQCYSRNPACVKSLPGVYLFQTSSHVMRMPKRHMKEMVDA